MNPSKNPTKIGESITTLTIAFLWIAAVVFYWSVDPTLETNLHTLASMILSYLVLWGLIFLLSYVSTMEMAQRFLLVNLSITLAVGFFELLVWAKVMDFRFVLGTGRTEPWHHPDNLLDPTLLHIRKPHLHFQWSKIDYRYDQHGLRNETDLKTADIVVIGDSFVEGWGVSAAELVTSHLANQMGRSVANLGQSWYGPQQELELLKRFGVPLHPKVCVWMFYEGNDLQDVSRYNRATMNWEVFSQNLHSFRQRSFTYNVVLALRQRLDSETRDREDTALMEKRSGFFETPSGHKIRIYFHTASIPLSEADLEALHQVRTSLGHAYELCRDIEANFLVVFAPLKFRVYEQYTEFTSHAEPRSWVINDLPERVAMIVREHLPQAKFLDLTPAFAESAHRGSLVYFPGWDTHWSPEGHRVAALAIADFLRRWKEYNDSVMRQ